MKKEIVNIKLVRVMPITPVRIGTMAHASTTFTSSVFCDIMSTICSLVQVLHAPIRGRQPHAHPQQAVVVVIFALTCRYLQIVNFHLKRRSGLILDLGHGSNVSLPL